MQRNKRFAKKLFYIRKDISEKPPSYTRLDETFINYRRYLKLKNTFFDKLHLKEKCYYLDKKIPFKPTRLAEVST